MSRICRFVVRYVIQNGTFTCWIHWERFQNYLSCMLSLGFDFHKYTKVRDKMALSVGAKMAWWKITLIANGNNLHWSTYFSALVPNRRAAICMKDSLMLRSSIADIFVLSYIARVALDRAAPDKLAVALFLNVPDSCLIAATTAQQPAAFDSVGCSIAEPSSRAEYSEAEIRRREGCSYTYTLKVTHVVWTFLHDRYDGI